MKSIDGYLDDGIRNQTLEENPVTKEMAFHQDKQEAVRSEQLPRFSPEDIYKALMEVHGRILANEKSNPEFPKVA